MIADLEPEIRRIVAGLLDKMKGKTRIDVVDEFAYPLPVTVICQILGVPLEAEPRFHAWIQAALDGLNLGPGAASEEQRRGAASAGNVTEFRQCSRELYPAKEAAEPVSRPNGAHAGLADHRKRRPARLMPEQQWRILAEPTKYSSREHASCGSCSPTGPHLLVQRKGVDHRVQHQVHIGNDHC
jgi:hypothetical protein